VDREIVLIRPNDLGAPKLSSVEKMQARRGAGSR
jgi:hypothetical protein